MDFITTIKLALDTLKRQRARSILTIAGIAVGISIVIMIRAAGRGLDKLILGQLEAYSPDLISMETKIPSAKQTSNDNAFGQASGITITTMKNKDIDEVRKHPNIISAYGMVFSQDIVSYGGQNKTTLIFGEGYSMPEVEKFELSEGRIFDKDEEESLAQVAVLGSTVKENLFGDDTAAGKTIYIRGKPFRVVGVAKKRGSALFMDMDDIVILPTLTMQKKILGIDYVRQIIAKMKDRNQAGQTVEDLAEILRIEHGITDPDKDDFAINTMDQAKEMMGSIVDGVTFLLVALVCISLVVGGVGIMNIMYVSVAERTFEIGLRKALGARKKDILLQFLSEAVLITVSGGIVGIILGALMALLVYFAAAYYGLSWVYSIPFSSVFLAVTFSAFIGLLFGIYPARKAANLNPIDALRRE